MSSSFIPLAAMALATTPASGIDIATMWDFQHPEVSEQRFSDAMAHASRDEALILKTQIARTYGLRKRFEEARALLQSMSGPIGHASAEARARWWLELGRTWSSAAHPAASQTDAAKAHARADYHQALAIARTARLDAIAIDATHMFAFVDTAPADQLTWDRQALALARASAQPDAQRWQASLLNNIGYSLHGQGQLAEALDNFNLALALRERGNDAEATRVARWMVAWTLRSLDRNDEALAMQLALEKDSDAAGEPDRSVYEELEHLYGERGNADLAAHYGKLKEATPE